jgi:hypothetical protein
MFKIYFHAEFHVPSFSYSFVISSRSEINIVARLLNARIVKPADTTVAR